MEIVDGTVIAVHGPLVRVQVADDTLVVASRRRLNWEGGTPSAARLVVGDGVTLEMRGEDGVIVAVHARRNSLLRKAPMKNRAQILAANVDQALLVFAAVEPEPKPGLLDRFLVACHLAGIEAVTELLPELALVRNWGLLLDRVFRTVHAHPTLSEALMEAAHGTFDRPIHL